MRRSAIMPIAAIAYITAAFLTFGWAYHRDCKDNIVRQTCSYVAGLTWPIYWSAKGSIELFRPENTHG